MCATGVQQLLASSHREAPLIANDPLADNTDLYAFGENIRYEIHIDNNIATPGDDIIYRFTFKKEHEDPSTFFYIRLGAQNHKTTYTLERSRDGGVTFTTLIEDGIVPPNNIGPRSINGPAGLNTTYAQLMQNALTTTADGERVFCGPTDDPFFVDLLPADKLSVH